MITWKLERLWSCCCCCCCWCYQWHSCCCTSTAECGEYYRLLHYDNPCNNTCVPLSNSCSLPATAATISSSHLPVVHLHPTRNWKAASQLVVAPLPLPNLVPAAKPSLPNYLFSSHLSLHLNSLSDFCSSPFSPTLVLLSENCSPFKPLNFQPIHDCSLHLHLSLSLCVARALALFFPALSHTHTEAATVDRPEVRMKKWWMG